MEYNELNSNKQEPERLKIEKIEKLESISNNYKRSAIIYGSLVGIWGLCAILNCTRILIENDPSFSLQLAFSLDIICSGLNAMLSHSNYTSMKETNKEINKIKSK